MLQLLYNLAQYMLHLVHARVHHDSLLQVLLLFLDGFQLAVDGDVLAFALGMESFP